MFTTIGVLLTLAGLFLMVGPKLGFTFKNVNLTNKLSKVILAIGVFVIMIPYLFFYSQPGYQYVLINPFTGNKHAVMSEGVKPRFFAKIIEMQKFIDVKVVPVNKEGTPLIDKSILDEIEGVMVPISVRFIDQVTATGFVSVRFQLPQVEEDFIKLAIKFRSSTNLVYNTLIPTIRAQLKQTGFMFSAQDYISGEAQGFRQTFEEMLKGGTFKVEKTSYNDTIMSPIINNDEQRVIADIQTRYRVEKMLDKNGVPIRIAHEITENKVIVSQVIVDKISLESTFKKRLEKQRDESAKRQLEQQKIETAKAAQSRIKAEGERDKTQERATQEVAQVKTLIKIETKLKQEKTNKQLAEIAYETKKLKAKAQKVTADAQSYENRKLQNAGLTPLDKARIDKEKSIGVAAEWAKLTLPVTMTLINSGSSGGKELSVIESLIGANLVKGSSK